MKIQFNEAQLSRPQQKSLIEILDVLQSENKNELVVTPVEFPIKLKVKLDDEIEMMLGWDAEKQSYAGLTKPETTEPEPKPDPIPEPELDLSPVIERSQAFACALAKLTKPLERDHRFIVWVDFLTTLLKELE